MEKFPLDFDHYDYNNKCLETIEIGSTNFSYSILKEKMICSYSDDHQFMIEDDKPVLLGNITKRLGKTVHII